MNAIALNILMVIKRLFCCIFSFLLPFILLIGGYFYTTKTSTFSHPDYTVGFRFTLNQPLPLKRVAGSNYCRLGITPYPEDELLNLSFKIYITWITPSLQYLCLFIKMRDMVHQFRRLILN